MTSIDQLICQAINPFDPATFKPGNFWYEQPDLALEVDSIHQEAIAQVTTILDQVITDHQTRTLLLAGDSGSGKSYLLGRIKRTLNPQASFVYIDPFPERESLWRHILRYTVDGLVQTPTGQPESQLLRWLKQLAVLDPKDTKKWGKIKRSRIIQKLKDCYPSGIYNATEFFGVLYDLIDPDRYPIACEWLRGDDMDDEGLALLKVQGAIATEDAAQKMLANFGRIAADTQPIILCFDQLDNIARTETGIIDLQAIFDVNSSLHNQEIRNFLVIVSIITSTWRQQSSHIQAADRARIDQQILLRPISLNQAEALWAYRLAPLHHRAEPTPESAIVPFNRGELEQKFPGGKTHPRNVLELGRRLFQRAKTEGVNTEGVNTEGVNTESVANRVGASGTDGAIAQRSAETQSSQSVTAPSPITPTAGTGTPENLVAAFRLLWRQELTRSQERITRIRQLAPPDLIMMLQEVLAVLKVDQVRSRLLPSQTYTNQSLSYAARPLDNLLDHARIGLVWNDDPNMTTFYHVMNACRRVVDLRLCQKLYLIRSGPIGKPNRKSYRLYHQIFDGNPHQRIRVDLLSIHYLATYHGLVNAVHAKELMVAGVLMDLPTLESLMRKARILRNCRLLQDLGLVWGRSRPAATLEEDTDPVRVSQELETIREFLLDLVNTHHILGVAMLIETATGQFPNVPETQWQNLIKDLCKTKQARLLDPKAKLEAQLICANN
ncbi:MAG: ATP-binding protein [Cyanothece sp. SIO2G6]|nr:ATP-binding protein [Cyanothece sp. SIO2G6]